MNRVFLMGTLRGWAPSPTLSRGKPQAEWDLETQDVMTDPRTGQSYARAQLHRLVVMGENEELARLGLVQGATIQAEGKLSYRQGRPLVRVSSWRVVGNVETEIPSSHTPKPTPVFSTHITRTYE